MGILPKCAPEAESSKRAVELGSVASKTNGLDYSTEVIYSGFDQNSDSKDDEDTTGSTEDRRAVKLSQVNL